MNLVYVGMFTSRVADDKIMLDIIQRQIHPELNSNNSSIGATGNSCSNL